MSDARETDVVPTCLGCGHDPHAAGLCEDDSRPACNCNDEQPTEMASTKCDRCGYDGEPNPHDLTEPERQFAMHFLSEIYKGEGDERRSSYPPAPVGVMLREDPHYMLCQTAIRRARRLLLAFPVLATERSYPPE